MQFSHIFLLNKREVCFGWHGLNLKRKSVLHCWTIIHTKNTVIHRSTASSKLCIGKCKLDFCRFSRSSSLFICLLPTQYLTNSDVLCPKFNAYFSVWLDIIIYVIYTICFLFVYYRPHKHDLGHTDSRSWVCLHHIHLLRLQQAWIVSGLWVFKIFAIW